MKNLRNERDYINRKIISSLAGHIVFSVLYLAAVFFLCHSKTLGWFLLLLGIYVAVEGLLCVWHLRLLRKPIDHMLDMVKRASQDEYRAQTLRSQAEVFALQSQINPHFLYNTLDTIRGYALQQNAEDIAAMTESLSTLFRYSISRPGAMATLGEELENVKNYLLIQQYRFPDKVEYIEEIEDVDILDYRMPILTIQPIVENAIHHGLEMKIGKGYIKVKGFRTDSNIILLISDNGLGMSEDTLAALRRKLSQDNEEDVLIREQERKKKGSSIALLNVDRRLKFYYGRQYGLKVRSTLDIGTMVEISLPLDKKKTGEGWEEDLG